VCLNLCSLALQLRNHFRQKNYLINTRNRTITTELRRTYQNRTVSGELNVFCVSNTYYWEHRASNSDLASEYLHLSNILALRSYCIGLVAQSQLREATEYIRDSVPALLGSIELWIQSGVAEVGVERRQAIRNSISQIELQFQGVSLMALSKCVPS
jgi:hypothetical protein